MKTVHLVFEQECGHSFFVKAFERLVDAEAFVENMNPSDDDSIMHNQYVHREVELIPNQENVLEDKNTKIMKEWWKDVCSGVEPI